MEDQTQMPSPPPQDSDMDEFESSAVTQKKSTVTNSIKIIKIGSIVLVVILLVGIAAYAVSMLGRKDASNGSINTVKATAFPTEKPVATQGIAYPEEFSIIEGKIENYENDLTGPQEDRTKLNIPTMDMRATF